MLVVQVVQGRTPVTRAPALLSSSLVTETVRHLWEPVFVLFLS